MAAAGRGVAVRNFFREDDPRHLWFSVDGDRYEAERIDAVELGSPGGGDREPREYWDVTALEEQVRGIWNVGDRQDPHSVVIPSDYDTVEDLAEELEQAYQHEKEYVEFFWGRKDDRSR